MVDLNDELLSAYLDGELDASTRTAVSSMLASDPEARARLEALRGADAALQAAFPLEAAPAGALALLRSSEIVSFPLRARRTWPAFATSAMAAAAAIAVFAGPVLTRNAGAPDLGPGYARGDLAAALESRPSGPAENGLRMVVSLKAADGRFCREYERASAGSVEHGVACKTDKGWSMIATAEKAKGGGYQTAGGDGAIDAALDRLDAAPLEPSDEAVLLAHGWRH